MKAQEELEKILAFDTTIECKEELVNNKTSLLRRKEEELERLASLAEKMTATTDGEVVSRSRNLDPLGEAVAKKEEKEQEIKNLKQEIENIKNEMVQMKAEHEKRVAHYTSIIDNLRKPVFIKVLYGKYFLKKTLQQIADEIGTCYRNVCYLHGNALQAVEKAEKKSE